MGFKAWIKKKTTDSAKAELRRRLFKEESKKAIEKVGAPYAMKGKIAAGERSLAALDEHAAMLVPQAEYLAFAHKGAKRAEFFAKPGSRKAASAAEQVKSAERAIEAFNLESENVTKSSAELKADIIRMSEELPYIRANAAGARREFAEKWGKSPLRVAAGDLGSSVVEGVKSTAHHWNPATLDFGYKPKKDWTKMEKFDFTVPTAIADFLLPKSVKPVTKQNVGRAAAAPVWGAGGFAVGEGGHAAVTAVADGIRSDDRAELEKNNRAFADEKTVRPEILSDVGLLKHYVSTKLIPEYRGLMSSTNAENRIYAAELTQRRLAQMEGTDAFNALIEERRAAQLRGDAQDDARLRAFDSMTTFQKLGGE